MQNKESVETLFGEVASKIADRPGGYTRIIKLAGTRLGDNAEMCFIELVDFNTLYSKEGAAKKAKTRRSRRGKKDEAAGETEEGVATAEATEGEPKAEKKAKKTAEPKAEKSKPAAKPKKKKE